MKNLILLLQFTKVLIYNINKINIININKIFTPTCTKTTFNYIDNLILL